MERWGSGYDEVLRPRNPGLVYASVTGFGRSGPYAARLGYHTIIEAMGGLMSITGEPAGEPPDQRAIGSLPPIRFTARSRAHRFACRTKRPPRAGFSQESASPAARRSAQRTGYGVRPRNQDPPAARSGSRGRMWISTRFLPISLKVP